MKRLFIDISHILKATMYVAQGFDSATMVDDVAIPDADEGYELFLISYQRTLKELKMTPMQTVLVMDGKGGKDLRREFLPDYSVRPKGPKEWMEQFYKAQSMVEETILKYGGISVQKDGYEADDLLAALAGCNDIIWSGDKDLLAAGNVYYKGQMNEDKFLGIAKRHIVVYKSLVGDQSDKIPGCKNFGEKTFVKMVANYGDDCLDEFLEMLENETLSDLEDYKEDFLGFVKILDNEETVYNSYKCAKFYHPGYQLEWKMLYPEGNGDLRGWDPVTELITEDKLTDKFLHNLEHELFNSPYNTLDIETYTTEEGRAWEEANKTSNGKKPLDVYGSKLAGFSITTGANSHISYYFPVDHKDTKNLSLDDAEYILNLLPDTERNIPLLVHNVSFELPVLRNHFDLRFDRGYLSAPLYDTQIMSMCVDEYEPKGLKVNSKKWLGYDQVSYETVLGDKSGMDELTGKEVVAYGIDDTVTTSALYRQFKLIMDYEETWDAYEKIDHIPQFLYAESFLTGVKFDLDKLDELQKENQVEYEKCNKEIQNFLVDLEWVEEVEVDKPPTKRATLADLKNLKPQDIQAPTYEEIHHRWPGCEFVPAVAMTPAEIKRLYKIYTGTDLKCKVRKLDKIADIVEELGVQDLADLVRAGDLEGLNNQVEDNFTPDPQLNLRSPKQMCHLLYDVLGYEIRIRGKLTDIMREKGQSQGNPSANDDAIAHARIYDAKTQEEKDFLKLLVKTKSCLTEESLFYAPYKNMPNPEDGYVHPQGGQAGAKSGRPTSSNPNFSQVSKKSRVREVYIPLEDDHVWVSFDFESQELGICAEQSQDKAMLACFEGERKDIHSMTATTVYNLKAETPLDYAAFKDILGDESHELYKDIKEARDEAKAVNFLDIYMGTAPTLAVQLLCSEYRAQEILDAKRATFPGVVKWQEDMSKLHIERGYAVTPYGRRRHLRLDGSWRDAHELRGGINHCVQGPAGEMLKLVMKRVWRQRVLEDFNAFFLFGVYDELNFSVLKSQALEFIKTVHEMMLEPFADFKVKILSSIELGPNFGELTNIGNVVDEDKINKVLESI